MSGTSAKFDVVDEQGVKWRVKMGSEARPETAATRLVWAAGYYADEDYFLSEIRVEKLPKLKRGNQNALGDGIVHDVRLERKRKGEKKSGNWSWSKNPFVGTKELNGLRIMMALINNWDLKDVNNSIYAEKEGGTRYVVTDLGATFGRTGNTMTRSKDNLKDYRDTKFIQEAKADYVDFYMSSRPLSVTVVDLPYYEKRTKMQSIAKHIPIGDAKWLGQVLGQLSAEQIRDCFRAAGYTPEEVEGYATVVQGRIAELNQLPGEARENMADRK